MIISDNYPIAILYVDDDIENLESFKAVFRREYNVYLANSAKEAIDILEQTAINVLMTDQRMPEMTGSELLESLAEKYPDMLRYILTGFSDFDPLVRALNDGKLHGYFSKPLDPDLIKDRIKDGMGKYYLKKENEDLYLSLRESEQQVREQLAELEQVYTAAPVGLILVDKDLRVIRVNEKLAEIDGLSVKEHIGKTLEEIVPDLIDQLKAVYLPVLEKGEPALNIAIHGTTQAHPGCTRDWLGSYYPFRNNNGEITGVIGGVVEITLLKKAEKDARKARLFTENLLQTTNAMILVLDLNGLIQLINPKVEELTGYTSDELIGQNWFERVVPIETYPHVREEFKRLMAHGSLHLLEYRIVTKSGEELTISWSNSVMEEKGTYTGTLSVGIDITERKIAEGEKQRLSKHLQQAQKMESIGNLAGGIAHDFNNILSSVLGYTELALVDAEKGSQLEDYLQEVLAAGKRAKNLVAQILTIARQTDEEIKPVRVDTIVSEVLRFIRSSISTSIDIQQNLESNSLIMANATQIHQVILNLCTNAAHAMNETGGIMRADLKDVSIDQKSTQYRHGLASGKYIELKISDTGAGIPSHIIGSIFEPYFTTKGHGEGTGIGLALVHSIIESIGGKVFVSSQLGHGTVFTSYLPITEKFRSNRKFEIEKLPTGTERIMIVDDEEAIVKMYNRILERLGYLITTSTSSIEALELFRSTPNSFDLVITDMAMPKMTGDKLAMEFMKINPEIPVILCTGYSTNISEEKAYAIGIKAFATKPLIKSDLAKIVRKVLDISKSDV